MKHKRVWTEEQRQAAAERMRSRMAQKKEKESSVAVEERPITTGSELKAIVEEVQPTRREVAPEVQAVIDSMDSERKVKMEMMRARQIAELSQTKEGREALARLEESKHPSSGDVSPMRRPGSYELSIIVRNDGTMVSQFGPCLCGAGKRQWHKICLEAESETMK